MNEVYTTETAMTDSHPLPSFAVNQHVRIIGETDSCNVKHVYTIAKRRRYGNDWEYHLLSPTGLPCGWQPGRFLEAA